MANNGSLGVQDPMYEQYALMHPDLMQDYQQNWAGRGVTLSEYGAMHYHEYGKNEGRGFPGQGGSAGGGGGGGAGGGGGGGNDPYLAEMRRQEEAARQAEAQRKAEMDKNIGNINSVFDDRAKQFDKYGNDLYDHNKKMFDENADEGRRQTTFAMARTGQTGGSVDAETNAELEKLYQQGLTNLRSGSTDAAGRLKSQDNAERNSLLQMASSGNYRSMFNPSSNVGNSTSMTTLNSGVGNQFSSLLGGIGGASRRNNPWGY